MNRETLDKIIDELVIVDKIKHLEQQIFTPEQNIETRFFKDEIEEKRVAETILSSLHDYYEPKIEFTSALTYSAPSTVGISTMNYSKPDSFYVHVPSWVKVHRAPFHEFGSNLFGLAYTFTGDVHIREDLQDNQFSEVLFHEVLHQMYPTLPEQQIRSLVLARMGSAAEIHTHMRQI